MSKLKPVFGVPIIDTYIQSYLLDFLRIREYCDGSVKEFNSLTEELTASKSCKIIVKLLLTAHESDKNLLAANYSCF